MKYTSEDHKWSSLQKSLITKAKWRVLSGGRLRIRFYFQLVTTSLYLTLCFLHYKKKHSSNQSNTRTHRRLPFQFQVNLISVSLDASTSSLFVLNSLLVISLSLSLSVRSVSAEFANHKVQRRATVLAGALFTLRYCNLK